MSADITRRTDRQELIELPMVENLRTLQGIAGSGIVDVCVCVCVCVVADFMTDDFVADAGDL